MLKLRIVVGGDLQNMEMIGDTSSLTAPMRNLKYFLEDDSKQKPRLQQLDFIGALLMESYFLMSSPIV